MNSAAINLIFFNFAGIYKINLGHGAKKPLR